MTGEKLISRLAIVLSALVVLLLSCFALWLDFNQRKEIRDQLDPQLVEVLCGSGFPAIRVEQAQNWLNGLSYDEAQGQSDQIIGFHQAGYLEGLCNPQVLPGSVDRAV